MAVSRQQLDTFFQDLFGMETQIDLTPNGLQFEGDEKIISMAFAVSATLPVIRQAHFLGVKALFVHHGFFWPNEAKAVVGAKREKYSLLLQGGINLYAYHLPLDILPAYGNNFPIADRMAEAFSVSNIELFEGVGCMVSLSQPIGIDSFFPFIDSCYRRPGVHINPANITQTDRIVILSGQGTSYTNKIVEFNTRTGFNSGKKITSFVTGEASEWVYSLAHDFQFTYSAMGHNNSEEIGPRHVMKLVEEKLKIKTFFIEEDNPF